MLYVCFTYAPDAPLLEFSARRLRQLDPEAIIVAISDSAAPIPSEHAPNGVLHRVSDFPRNGNLNGLDCILGMLQTMVALCKEFDADHIIKFDADLWANNIGAFLTSVDSGSFDYLATERWHFGQPAGYIYRLSARLLDRLAEEITSRQELGLFPPSNKYPEDQTIYALAMQCRASASLIPFTSGASTGVVDCTPEQLARAMSADVVHVGEPNADGSRASRLLVLGRMATLAHYARAL